MKQGLQQVEPQGVLRVAFRARRLFVHFEEDAVNARCDTGARERLDVFRLSGRDAVASTGQLQAVRHVEDDRHAQRPHHRERPHVDDKVVIPETGAAFGDEDVRVARVDDFRDHVFDIVGREELSLLHVHDPAGPRRGDEQIGLP